jgi:outer membrane receptor protein involved in Fe transport
LTGSLSLARSFRAPTVQELFANGLDAPSGTYTVGTPGLEPETGLGADLSLKGNFANASFEISPYANSIQHYIYGFLRGDTIQNFPVRQFGETNARLLGFDASVTVQPAQYIALRAGVDYVNAEDTRQHVPLPFTPPLRGLLRATFQNSTYMGLIETRLPLVRRDGDGDTPRHSGYTVVNIGAGMRLRGNVCSTTSASTGQRVQPGLSGQSLGDQGFHSATSSRFSGELRGHVLKRREAGSGRRIFLPTHAE